MEVFNLTLSGGEPLAHPDFLAMGARARELGFVVRVKSNGHALRGELARRLRDEVDPFLVEVSLHGATRRHPRPPDPRAGQLRPPAGQPRGAAVAGPAGEAQQHAHRLERGGDRGDVRPRRLPRAAPSGGSRGDAARRRRPRAAGGRRQPRGDAGRLFRLQLERARLAEGNRTSEVARGGDDGTVPAPAGKHCGAGSSGIAVDPYGNVYPCVQWRRPVGNLHQQAIREIWRGSAGLRGGARPHGRVKDEIEAQGPGGHLLNFCPGSAAAHTGSPLQVYGPARQRKELLEQVIAETGSITGSGPRPLLPVVS